jgi:excisionase family DNA binding protein
LGPHPTPIFWQSEAAFSQEKQIYEVECKYLPELFTLDEAAEKLRISISKLRRLIAKNVISYYVVGVRVMFSSEHLNEFLESVEKRKTEGLPDLTIA